MTEIEACDLMLGMLKSGSRGLGVSLGGGLMIGTKREIRAMVASKRKNNRIARRFNRLWRKQLGLEPKPWD